MKKLMSFLLTAIVFVSAIMPTFAVKVELVGQNDEVGSVELIELDKISSKMNTDPIGRSKIGEVKESKAQKAAGDIYTYKGMRYIIADDEAVIVDYDSNLEKNLTIPGTLKGYPVKKIYDGAFMDCEWLESVNTRNVTVIGSGAFLGCGKLKTVKMDKVTKVNDIAFALCSRLTKFDVSNSEYKGSGKILYNNAKTKIISYPSASGSITIPDSVKTVGRYSFAYCIGLTSVNTRNATTVGTGAFYECADYINGLEAVSMPKVKTIYDYAFFGNYWLSSVSMPKAQKLKGFAFSNCLSMRSITIPSTVTEIESGIFVHCPYLSIKVSSSNKNYSSYNSALYNKTRTKIIAYPTASGNKSFNEKTKTVAAYAFYGCENLTGITLPGATTIGMYSFYGCPKLKKASFKTAPSVGSYSFAECTALQEISIPKATRIRKYAFSNCTNLKKVVCTNVEEINTHAFDGCENLPELNASKLHTINSYAFRECSSLRKVVGGKISYIGKYAFKDCYGLIEIDLDNMKSISTGAFYNTGIVGVNLPKATKLYAYAFKACNKLKMVKLPKVTEIGNNAFEACAGLETVSVPSVVKVGDRCFKNCSSLKTVRLPYVTELRQQTFYGCVKLESADILSVRLIRARAFEGCESLKSVNMPYVKQINHDAFTRCSSLESVLFRDIYKMEYDAFKLCEKLKTATFYCDAPEGIENICADIGASITCRYAYGTQGWSDIPETTGIKPFAFTATDCHRVCFADSVTGEVLRTFYVTNGSRVFNMPEAPEHSGYTFLYWDYDDEPITGNRYIYAIYKRV